MKLIKITAVWCMSCILMNEVLKAVEKDNKINYETINYDYDTDANEIKSLNIGTILPIYILIDNEKEIGRSIGEKSQKELIEFLSSKGAIK